jgi:hypothetical protein
VGLETEKSGFELYDFVLSNVLNANLPVMRFVASTDLTLYATIVYLIE